MMMHREHAHEAPLGGAWRVFAGGLHPYRYWFALMLLCVLLGNAAAASIPYFLKLIVDIVTTPGASAPTLSDFAFPLTIIIAILISQEVFYRIGHVIETHVVVGSYDRLTSSLYEMLLARPTAYFEDRFAGEMSRRIDQVGTAAKYFMEFFPWEMGWIVTTSIVVGILLSTAHPLLIGVYMLWIGVFLTISIPLLTWQSHVSQIVSERQAALNGSIVDALGNIGLVHAFAAHEHEYSYFRRSKDAEIAAEKHERYVFILNKMHQGVSVALLGGSLTFVSVYLFTRGGITVGDFVIVAAAIPSMTSIIWNFGDAVLRAIREYGEFQSAVEALAADGPAPLQGDRVSAPREARITFDHVSFSYPSSDADVFADFSLTIEAGERVGIVGRSGAGKSTLVKLLLRQYEPETGSIRIGDADISSFRLAALRRLISFVPQDTSLFHRSLYENILYANPSASRERVMEASRLAHADEFIRQFPAGYDTRVGERGVKLSGGERQRIAIARAMLKDAPVLILDEATSALDTESEHIVQQGLEQLFKGRTVVAIAHRLSTLRAMDRIVVFDGGRVAEEGAPEDLIQRQGGIFRTLWEQQKDGFVQ